MKQTAKEKSWNKSRNGALKMCLNAPYRASNIPGRLRCGNGLKDAPLHERDRVDVYSADLCRNS